MANDDIINDIDIDYLSFSQNYFFSHGCDIILDLLKFLPEVKISVEFLQNLFKNFRKFRQKAEDTRESNEDKIETYLRKFTAEGGICEFDSLSELLTKCINKIKEGGKKVVLVIEDLDRIDPAHIFRILNVISAHLDRVNILPDEYDCNQQNNKFNLDKIIVVCDYNNIEKIFHHFYGKETDFEGYINKFSTTKPFHYSLKKNVQKYITKRLSQIFQSQTYKRNPIKFLEKELYTKTIRECVYILDTIEDEIKPGFFSMEKYKIDSVNPGTKLLILLKRLGIDLNSVEFSNRIIKEDLKELTNIIGVNWLLIYDGDSERMWIPSGRGMHTSIPICLKEENNVIRSIDFRGNFFNPKEIIDGIKCIYEKLQPYIKS